MIGLNISEIVQGCFLGFLARICGFIIVHIIVMETGFYGGKNFMMQTLIYFVFGIDFIVLTQFLF